MTEPLFEAVVLGHRAVSHGGRVYLAGEKVLLPLSEANALEEAGFVIVAGTPAVPARKPRTKTTQ